MTWLM